MCLANTVKVSKKIPLRQRNESVNIIQTWKTSLPLPSPPLLYTLLLLTLFLKAYYYKILGLV